MHLSLSCCAPHNFIQWFGKECSVVHIHPKMSHESDATCRFYLRLYVTQKVFFATFLLGRMMTYPVAQPPANYSTVYVCFPLSPEFLWLLVAEYTLFYGFTHVRLKSITGCFDEERKKNRILLECVCGMAFFPNHTLSLIGLDDILDGILRSYLITQYQCFSLDWAPLWNTDYCYYCLCSIPFVIINWVSQKKTTLPIPMMKLWKMGKKRWIKNAYTNIIKKINWLKMNWIHTLALACAD